MPFNTSTNEYQNTKYIVDSAGGSPYATVQSAITAAQAIGIPATIFIRAGTYTENLTLYNGIELQGSNGFQTVIIGKHIPPTAGRCALLSIGLQSATHILDSVAAGTATIKFSDCTFNLTNGFVCHMTNWTGSILFQFCSDNSTANGIILNTAAANVSMLNNTIGAGTTNVMTIDGVLNVYNTGFGCPITLIGAAVTAIDGGASFSHTVTIGGTANVSISNSRFATGTETAIVQNSTLPLLLNDVNIASSNANAIDGTGTVYSCLCSFSDSLGTGTATHTLTGLSALGTGYMTGAILESFSTAGVVVNDDTGALNSINDNTNVGYVLTTNATGGPTFQIAGGGGIGTLDGDSGSATGATVTIAGTTDQITTTGDNSATVTLSTPSTFTSPGSVTATTNFVLPATSSTVGQITQKDVGGTVRSFIHTYGNAAGNSYNIFIGHLAGNFTMTTASARFNVGIGSGNLSGSQGCLHSLTTGSENAAFGYNALCLCTTGSCNTCIGGTNSLSQLVTGNCNLALGGTSNYGSGYNYTGSESNNILLVNAGVTGDNNTLRIADSTGTGVGQLNKAYICGISGITVTGTAVLISATDQLGVAVSSAKYKKDITDMPDMSQVIDKLRPVTFHYKDEKQSAQLNYGLIAEEVEPIWPEMVAYDKDGNISTLYYQFLAPVLLKEIKDLRKRIEQLESKGK